MKRLKHCSGAAIWRSQIATLKRWSPAAATTPVKLDFDMADKQHLILVDQIEPLILEIRGQKVLLDKDLADLYGAPTKRLN